MPRVVLMCGPAGSGKTTRARALEDRGFLRLSIDTEAWARGFREQPLPDEVAVEIETHLRNRLIALIRDGVDVVLDYSFWSQRMRAEYRALIESLGSTAVTLYVDTPRDVALARVAARSGSHLDDIALTPPQAESYYDHFEVPTQDEGPLIVVSGMAVSEIPQWP
ncbi:AAA family ATPase [Nocardia carnea]|uniref:AAA family ATPase n=1 Tax=Nocardia carnea TaxID=37328 RepID=UPI002455BBAE|nr:ATP-binding protein [Nocardia carnea]